MNIGMNNNNKNEQTISFDVGLEVRINRNGEIDNWEPIKQHIEREYREYVTEGERNGW
jgi:hypothetical protein